MLYANVTPQSDGESMGPRLLAPQNSTAAWPLQLGVYVPPSDKPSALHMVFVMTPEQPLELPLELALQAVGQFHRRQFNVASILLAASVEASLRARLEKEYVRFGVSFDDRTMFQGLLERARLLLRPAPGPKLVGNLNALAKEARNPAAHGRAVAVERNQVAEWMVDVAVVYEWTRLAGSAETPPATSPVLPT